MRVRSTRYALPLVRDVLNLASSGELHSKIDLANWFMQFPLERDLSPRRECCPVYTPLAQQHNDSPTTCSKTTTRCRTSTTSRRAIRSAP
jgi:hypothetical protein